MLFSRVFSVILLIIKYWYHIMFIAGYFTHVSAILHTLNFIVYTYFGGGQHRLRTSYCSYIGNDQSHCTNMDRGLLLLVCREELYIMYVFIILHQNAAISVEKTGKQRNNYIIDTK